MTNLSDEMKTQAKLSGRSNEINQVPEKNSLLVEGAEEIERLQEALQKCGRHEPNCWQSLKDRRNWGV